MSATPAGRDMTLLFTCVGRRVELLQAFRAAARRLGINLRLIGTDTSLRSPGMACVDERFVTGRVTESAYSDQVLEIVREHKVRALIPTIDPDLPVISSLRDPLREAGCEPMIAEPGVVEACGDKIRTFEFLRRHHIDTPETFAPSQLPPRGKREYPYFLKPRGGSASIGAHKLEDERDLEYYLAKIRDPIVQEFVAGKEHTLDVYVGLTGEPRCVVPRLRWETRGGEVVKGVVVKDSEIMEAGRRVALALGPSVRGLVTLQCMVTPQRRICFIEINARFGGGAPLGIAAGADYPGWLLQELTGKTPQIAMDGFHDGLCMLRYDWSAFAPIDVNDQPGKALSHFPPFDRI